MRKVTDIESLYIDFDAFFASAEKQLRPELRGRPVGVIPLDSKHTSLIARCYQAKTAGISRGTSVSEALAKCPNIALPIARHDEYVKLHNRIVEEVDRHVPVQKVWSIDEVECALIGEERTNCVNLAQRVKAGLYKNIGEWITPSIGLAPNQFLAKIAAEMEKPNGFTILRPADLPGPLFNLELTDLPGISNGMNTRLGRAGVFSVEHLWNLAPKQARSIWNSVEGERFWAQLHGYAVARPETVRRMFGHGRILSSDWRTPARARDCLRLLTTKAARRLRREHYLASRVTVAFSTTDNQRFHRDHHVFPARDDHTFLSTACRLFDDAITCSGIKRLKKVSIMLSGLSRANDVSADLFEQADAQSARLQWERTTDAIDSLNKRYQRTLVSLGPHREPPGGYAGAKIAFGRVPDADDFM